MAHGTNEVLAGADQCWPKDDGIAACEDHHHKATELFAKEALAQMQADLTAARVAAETLQALTGTQALAGTRHWVANHDETAFINDCGYEVFVSPRGGQVVLSLRRTARADGIG